MKKIIMVLCICILIVNTVFSVGPLDALAPTFAIELAASMKNFGEQSLYYVDSIREQIQAAQNTYQQLQHMIKSEERALNNLKGAADIRSFDDLVKFSNRQITLQRDAENRYKKFGLKIGNTNYKLSEIDKIPGALKTEYIDFWEEELSPAQRRELWLRHGMSASNYVYMTAWETKAKELTTHFLTAPDRQNE